MTAHRVHHTARSFILLLLGLAAGLAWGQPAGCDEGVIRLPDRSGTIQICSSLAARVPELARQLSQATAAMGSQQAQIAELTRLVRGLNNVGRNIGQQRQAEMLQSLSAQLEDAQRSGSTQALARINERLDSLQSSMLGALADPRMASALGEALKGPLGEAIAKLDLGSAARQIDDISERLKALQSSVAEVRGDTSAIRQQLAQMDQRQQAAEGARERRDAATVELMRKLSGEIRDLGQRGGLIDTPRGYSAHYHNARILSQRGEIDLAMASYREVFRTGVQMADPVIDLTTLLVRQYGRQGAERALARDFRKDLPDLSYLYALQLLAEGELDEVESLLFAAPQRVADFPPLAAVYLRRLHERLARKRQPLHLYTFQWQDTSGMAAVADRLNREIETGNYLAFYIDQVRAGRDLDDFRTVSDAFGREKILQTFVPNLGQERLPRQKADLRSSPVALDYTYFFEPPSHETLSDLARSAAAFPRYGKGSVFLFIWDAAVDPDKPIRVCGTGASASQCRDINTPPQRCSRTVGSRAVNCVMKHWIGSDTSFPPHIEAHFVANELLGTHCIGRVSYTTTRGREIVIEGRNLIGAFRRPVDPEARDLLRSCGYDSQALTPQAGSLPQRAATLTVPPFAVADRTDPQVPYNRESCEDVGRNSLVYGSRTLASYRMDAYLVQVARATNTLPDMPTFFDTPSGRFDDSDGKCKLRLVINGLPQVCTIERLLKSRWLPSTPDGPAGRNVMPRAAELWNGGIYPDSSSAVRCTPQNEGGVGSQNRPPAPRRAGGTIDQVQPLEASGVEHELVAMGAGHGPGCDTKGYTEIRSRVEIDLGLRAIERKICGSGETFRKSLLEAAQRAAQRLNGCFGATAMSAYSKKAETWLKGASADCAGTAGKRAQEWAQEAAEWAANSADIRREQP